MRHFTIGIIFLAMIIFSFGQASSAFAGGKGAVNNKKIVVIIDSQVLLAMEGTRVVYEYDVVTGRPKKETHPGDYRISRKYKDYTSKTYGSPMPYSMFFSKDGKAIHGTQWATIRSYLHAYVTESVGSQGCVGLTEEDAKTLFNWASVGTKIDVMEEELDD
jgi:lipoprotein-anchoring transpeptidase ErfK/SrfK